MFQTKCFYQIVLYTYNNLNFFFVIDERRLGMDEKPLLVQLNWHMDDREGRFLLRRIDDKTNVSKAFLHTSTSSDTMCCSPRHNCINYYTKLNICCAF